MRFSKFILAIRISVSVSGVENELPGLYFVA